MAPRAPWTVLDVGAHTGTFAAAFADWFGTEVIAVEPTADNRARIPDHPRIRVVDGHAADLPLPSACVDAAWLSRVVHHLPDLPGAAAELRRVLRPQAKVLIRETFPERCEGRLVVRFFPECHRFLGTRPSLAHTRAVFASAGFEEIALHTVDEWAAPSIAHFAMGLRRDADSLLRRLTDEEFARGMDRLTVAVREEESTGGTPRPITDRLDLLVLAAP